jgi:hypothetical protein
VATVYAVIEYLPIGANGAAGEGVLSEHPTAEEAVAAKEALYARRPELVGCLAIRAVERVLPVVVVAEVVTETVETEGADTDARPVAGGAGDGTDGVRREAGRGGRRAAVPEVRPDAGLPAGPPVGGAVLPV